jgi:hypothetical protein
LYADFIFAGEVLTQADGEMSDTVGLLIATVVLYDGETTGSVLKWVDLIQWLK